MNPVLEGIVATGMVVLPSGERVPANSHIDPVCGAMLQKAIFEVGSKPAVEVGLAFGVSTLYILDALAAVGAGRLIGMDPAQHDGNWRGGGLHNIERAGLAGLYEFHEAESQAVLPQLAARGERLGLGFIDGWHTFDHALLDFFYIDRMLEVGGIVVFDDAGYPAIRRVCEFVLSNRAYEVFDVVRHGSRPTMRKRAKRLLNSTLYPLYRTDKTPSHETRAKLLALEDACFVAMRKTGGDVRRWDHFTHF